MDVNEPHRQEDEAAAIDWLSPSEALAKFNLPDGVRFAGAQQEQPEARVRYGFRIGEIGLLVDPDCGSEVVGMPPISHLPGSPHGFMGLINLRGNLVPIYELRDLLGLGARKTASDLMMLVFGAGESAADKDSPAARLDRVLQVRLREAVLLELDAEGLGELEDGAVGGFFAGFLFFLAFYEVTQDYQSEIQLRSPILVGFFLAGRGDLPIARFLNTARRLGYEGMITYEVSPRELPMNREWLVKLMAHQARLIRLHTGADLE